MRHQNILQVVSKECRNGERHAGAEKELLSEGGCTTAAILTGRSRPSQHAMPAASTGQQGLIKAFEYTFELAWNTLRDLLRSQGAASLLGSREALLQRQQEELP